MQIRREAVGSGEGAQGLCFPRHPWRTAVSRPGLAEGIAASLPCGARAVFLELSRPGRRLTWSTGGPRPPEQRGGEPRSRAPPTPRPGSRAGCGAAAGRREEAPSPAPRSRPGAVPRRLAERSRPSRHHRSALPGMEISPPRVPRGLKGRRAAVTAREVTCRPQGSAGVEASLEPTRRPEGRARGRGGGPAHPRQPQRDPQALKQWGQQRPRPLASGFELTHYGRFEGRSVLGSYKQFLKIRI